MKHRFLVGAFTIAVLASAYTMAGEGPKSGLPVGGGPPIPFNPLSSTGPFEGKKQCLV